MALERTTYYIAVCDGCGPDWWEGDADEPPMFLTPLSARRELAADHEWRITQQVDGRFHMLCGRCAGREDCKKYGHQWVSGGSDRFAGGAAIPPTCHRCSQVRRDEEPPADGYPESMTTLLSDEDETALAEIDDITWPDDADSVEHANEAWDELTGEAA